MSFYEDKIFPYVLDVVLCGLKKTRKELISTAEGKVLEVGIGNGANLPYYSSKANEVVGIEPCSAMVDLAKDFLHKQDAESNLSLGLDRYTLDVGSGEELPYADNSFDTVVACLVFCTIPDAEKAAKEMFRVLKPEGRMLFLEHVHAKPGIKHSIQNFVNPAWNLIGCGCNLNRNTKALFSDAGFEYETIEEFQHHPRLLPLFSSVIKGVANKPMESA